MRKSSSSLPLQQELNVKYLKIFGISTAVITALTSPAMFSRFAQVQKNKKYSSFLPSVV